MVYSLSLYYISFNYVVDIAFDIVKSKTADQFLLKLIIEGAEVDGIDQMKESGRIGGGTGTGAEVGRWTKTWIEIETHMEVSLHTWIPEVLRGRFHKTVSLRQTHQESVERNLIVVSLLLQ